jgi:nucleoside-diphosphate-sugar epimerase
VWHAGVVSADQRLTVAVTGPTGTFGFGLIPLLQAEERVTRIVGIARRPFDPAARGWTKLEYRRGDVRDEAALRDAFAGADVVVHLAFLVTGGASAEVLRAVNVDGTVNAFRAARQAGAQWVEAASHPAIMDTTKAKRDLGWVPRFTALEALRDTLRPDPARR